MLSRRLFISSAVATGAGLTLAPLLFSLSPQHALAQSPPRSGNKKPYKLPHSSGLGGGPIGNGFKEISDQQAYATLEAAWNSGARYFDTSPFYGLTLSERRFGSFLHTKNRKDYILSTKVGRIFKPSKPQDKQGNWIKPSPFEYTYDYSASATRRSIEDSLQRMGVESLDIVFIHDLNEGNKDLGKKWLEHFEVARKGAMPELTKMREEGLIKGWGLGVNEIEPILKTLDVADPDIMLSATQYSLIKHEDALNRLFPACEKRQIPIVSGAPLNAGFISGSDRYDYSGTIPRGAKEKRTKMNAIAKEHGIDLRTAGLQFCAAPEIMAAVIPGARNAEQATQNQASMKVKIPKEFWEKMKSEKLIAANAPTEWKA